jgi:hypothetical protein
MAIWKARFLPKKWNQQSSGRPSTANLTCARCYKTFGAIFLGSTQSGKQEEVRLESGRGQKKFYNIGNKIVRMFGKFIFFYHETSLNVCTSFKPYLHWRSLLQKSRLKLTSDSHYCTRLGHLGWRDTNRIISISGLWPRQLKTDVISLWFCQRFCQQTLPM